MFVGHIEHSEAASRWQLQEFRHLLTVMIRDKLLCSLILDRMPLNEFHQLYREMFRARIQHR